MPQPSRFRGNNDIVSQTDTEVRSKTGRRAKISATFSELDSELDPCLAWVAATFYLLAQKLVFCNSDLDKSTTQMRTLMIYLFLTGVHPTSVHLIGGCLIGVYLTGVYLTGVYLTGVYLTGVYLTGVHLTGVHLTGVHLTGVHLTGVHLTA
jgi:Pentapeptide repeats (8 copies)